MLLNLGGAGGTIGVEATWSSSSEGGGEGGGGPTPAPPSTGRRTGGSLEPLAAALAIELPTFPNKVSGTGPGSILTVLPFTFRTWTSVEGLFGFCCESEWSGFILSGWRVSCDVDGERGESGAVWYE